MVNKIIWKVFLMLGGLIGTIYSIPQIVDLSDRISDYKKDDLLRAFGGSSISEMNSQMALWCFLLFASIICFLIGCCLSTSDVNNSNKENQDDSQ